MSRVDWFLLLYVFAYTLSCIGVLCTPRYRGIAALAHFVAWLIIGGLSFIIFDVARLADRQAHYELWQAKDGTRAWKYVEIKKGN